MLTLFIIQ